MIVEDCEMSSVELAKDKKRVAEAREEKHFNFEMTGMMSIQTSVLVPWCLVV